MPIPRPKSTQPQDEDTGSPEATSQAEDLEPEDYYFEGPNLVFTAQYHRKRGYCCNSGCRHCPYGGSA